MLSAMMRDKMAEHKEDALNESDYQRQLQLEDKFVYRKKINLLKGLDPYILEKTRFCQNVEAFPGISYLDMVNYLVLSSNPVYTAEEMRAYKGLEAHNQFTSGWVRDVAVAYMGDVGIITAKVLHSQSISEKATKPWIVAEKSGKILTANCDCKAGLGGTCTHVSAVLFWMEAAVRLREKKTVTQEKAYWLLPSGVQKVFYEPVHMIDFTSSQTKKRNLDSMIDNDTLRSPSSQLTTAMKIPKPSTAEIGDFLKGLNSLGVHSRILTVSEPFNVQYVPKVARDDFPKPLTNLRDETLCNISYDKLLERCADLKIEVTEKEAKLIESVTREQADSKLWFRYRAGRITASKMKAVCHTSVHNPAPSLIKQIVYPEAVKFYSKATSWGCKHEHEARKDYVACQSTEHANFQCSLSGLVINPDYPFLGASPDGVVSCSCCGFGLLEIKCPLCVKEATEHSCLIEVSPGVYSLDKNHGYYYQVQTQLFLCSKDYCDFVVWTKKGHHRVKILPDEKFWTDILEKATDIFYNVILLELVGKFYSRPALTDITFQLNENASLCCYCRKTGDIDRIISCRNTKCPFQKYHYSCLKLNNSPEKKGMWYCPECRKKPKPELKMSSVKKRKTQT